MSIKNLVYLLVSKIRKKYLVLTSMEYLQYIWISFLDVHQKLGLSIGI